MNNREMLFRFVAWLSENGFLKKKNPTLGEAAQWIRDFDKQWIRDFETECSGSNVANPGNKI